MPTIRRAGRATWSLPLLALLTAIGCSSRDGRDERLVQVTNRAIEQQARQNDHIAGQAKAVAEQSRQVAETAKELVASDAEARREMIDAAQTLNSELHVERRNIDRRQEKLDDEHRQIAAQRNRDPIIAAALEGCGLILACVLPLVVCIFVLRQLQAETGDERALAELLALELTSDGPTLLSALPPSPPLLDSSEARPSLPGPAGDDDSDAVEPAPLQPEP